MIKLLKQIHRIYTLFIIIFFFGVFYPFYYLLSRKPKYYSLLNKFRTLHSYICSFLIGIFFRFHYEEPLKAGQTYVYCSNHTSNLDIMILTILAKGSFHFMGKEDLLHNPVFKPFFKTIDIPVNRDSKMSSFRAFKRAGENLEKGMSLIIFPEGKIDEEHYPPQLQAFKSGPFRLAIDRKKDIVPISIADAWEKMWDDGGRDGTRPGICDIYIHKPISTATFAANDSDRLRDEVFNVINSKVISNENR
jgi:1-acyl-sn-glycerol-3-phosphate acyltransferase